MTYPPDKPPVIDPKHEPEKPNSNIDPQTIQLLPNRFDPSEHFKQVIRRMRNRSVSNSESTTPLSEFEPESEFELQNSNSGPDYTALLSDELLLKVLVWVSDKSQSLSNALVCKRWCTLSGKLIDSIRVLDWEFLESGRLGFRFPNLVDIDIVKASVRSDRCSGIVLSNSLFEVSLSPGVVQNDMFFVQRHHLFRSTVIDRGLRILSEGCRNLRRVVLMNPSEEGLGCLGAECEMLQEMELHCCDETSLRGLNKCRNLQILRLIAKLGCIYDSAISDIGLTLMAQGCKRLLKLELIGCEGSYDGIKAIGQCCQMLEELTISDHRMESGWLSALLYCENLKTLRITSCKSIDENPGQDEHLGKCLMLEDLYLRQCKLRDTKGVRALFLVCRTIRNLVVEDCWGLDDGVLASAVILRNIRSFSLEGCSLLTTGGLESIVLSWNELDRLKVISCNNIKDSEITPELATLFTILKELTWRPDSKSLLTSSLAGTGIGHKGGRSLRGK